MGATSSVATIEQGGHTLYDGRHMGTDHDVFEYAAAGGGAVLKRADGWAIDPKRSTVDLLVWNKPGEEAISWKRVAEAPTASVGNYAAQVESLQESEVCDQLGRTRYPPTAQRPAMPSLSGGGEYDALLLDRGGSQRLLERLPEIFRHDPANDAGRQPHAAGQFHGFRDVYGRKVFSPRAVARTLELAHGLYADAPNVLRLQVPPTGRLVVVGDTHGQLEDVLWIFYKYGVPTSMNQYLFNGDIVDRGGHALEILLLLLVLKRDDPSCVHILRGNHEDETTCGMFGFKGELESKFGPDGAGGWILSLCTTQVFAVLPLAAVVSDKTSVFSMCVLHGGIPVNTPGQRGPLTIDRLQGLNRMFTTVQKDRALYTADDHILFNLLWADPAKPGVSPVSGPTGRGNLFTEADTADFCRANRVQLVVRAHQVPEDGRGFCFMHGGRCLTVFSASNYCGNMGNRGGVLLCEGRSLAGSGPRPAEHTAPAWPALSDLLRRQAPPELRLRAAERYEAELRPEAGGPALQQVEQFVVQQTVRHKQRLFWEFSRLDTQGNGHITGEAWKRTMASLLHEVPPVWGELLEEWQLAEPVPYVQFLHRFQIVSEMPTKSRGATHIDVFHAMSQLRVLISDVHADELLAGLDRDLSGTVDLREFQEFLRAWRVEVPQWQTAALYEALSFSLGRNPAVEDVVLGIALVSRSPATSPCGSGWMDTAKAVGEGIAKSGHSLVGFFRQWDTDGSGFLSPAEVERALLQGVPSIGQHFSAEQIRVLARHMDAQGVQNDRVSLVEFLRAVGPRSLARELAGALLGEVLKPVLQYRSVLEAIFGRYDPVGSNIVSIEQFCAGLDEMNRQLKADGGMTLTDYQAQAVAEIASGNGGAVQYREFLRSLRVVDTVKRARRSAAALEGLRAAFGA